MAELPIHDERGQITAYGMRRALAEGGSVLWTDPTTKERKLIRHEADIPHASAFVAPGDVPAASRSIEAIDAQIAELEAHKAALAAKAEAPASLPQAANPRKRPKAGSAPPAEGAPPDKGDESDDGAPPNPETP